MLEELKRHSFEANMLLPKYDLVDLTFGNVSAIDRSAGILAIKPSGVAYEELKFGDMVLVDLEGNKVEGDLNPSSDTPTHVCLYRAFANIGGIVHTHSRSATVFAQAQKSIPCLGTTHADYFDGEVPVTRALTPTEIEGKYEWETGNVIVERFEDISPDEYPGVLVASHGPFAWGPTAARAVENAFAMELLAQMAFQTIQLNPRMHAIDQHLLDKHFQRKHGESAYYGQNRGGIASAPASHTA